MWRYLRDPTFSRFDTITECDRHTHRQTDRHTSTAYTTLSIASRGNENCAMYCYCTPQVYKKWGVKKNFSYPPPSKLWHRPCLCDLNNVLGGRNYHGPTCSRLCGRLFVRPTPSKYSVETEFTEFTEATTMTSGSAIAEGPRDMLVSRNSATTKQPI